jgi:predicted metal-dependent RNase
MRDEEGLPIGTNGQSESFRQKIKNELQDPNLAEYSKKNEDKRPLWAKFFGRRNRSNIDPNADAEDKQASYIHGAEESRSLERVPGPKIIIAGSGMSVGGRVIRHEEIYLPDPNSTILLVGYQTLGTIGRHLLDGDKKIKIGHDTIKVKAHIDSILGYSSHKDSDHLVEFVNTAQGSLKKVFVVMGEFKSSTFLSQRIKDELGIQAVCPEVAKTYELE